jgi:coatomer subunit beta'
VIFRVAKFLEARGHVEKALEVVRDPDYRFELAVQLNNFDIATSIAEQLASESRWKQLGEMALSDGRLELAERCLEKSGDFSGMMLMHSATGNRKGMAVRDFV